MLDAYILDVCVLESIYFTAASSLQRQMYVNLMEKC